MDLTKIIAITGKSGLFELLTQTKGGFIVKDLVAQKKLSINANSQVSLLQNISIYTLESEVSLISVLVSISKKHNFKEIEFDKNDINTLRSLMKDAQSDYAEDRVYNSDLKKLFTWYNILVKNEIITEENVKAYEVNLARAEEKLNDSEEEKSEKSNISQEADTNKMSINDKEEEDNINKKTTKKATAKKKAE
ncbi:hypothetical protein Ga0061079_11128 [Apibacter mensalis]|uniref:Uncharacterized protein n=1 Tax=Apibacter mensalis TaxID=1586267 RepID=A0A0X3AR31_9FLAO|nr:DUF5606 domain-containing protein [Apibacter mensalis]CVK16836.1 hypothetical protein Ga0061079_11128 [Apibacter mensalis]